MKTILRVTAALAGLATVGGLAPVLPAAAQTTVEEMTCAQARRSAAATGRYYKRTGFGVVPIFPVFPPQRRAVCASGEWQAPQSERTRDGQCVVAYKCEQRPEIWDY